MRWVKTVGPKQRLYQTRHSGRLGVGGLFFFFYENSNGKKWIRNPVIERCVYWTDGRTGQNEPYAIEGTEV